MGVLGHGLPYTDYPPPFPIHSTSNTPDLRESHRSSWRQLGGEERTPGPPWTTPRLDCRGLRVKDNVQINT